MNKFLNNTTTKTTPYVAGEQPRDGERVIKINTNENPYPPSPRVAQAVAAEIDNLRLYPSPDAAGARRAFGAAYGVPPENVFVSNGSDEALSFAFMAFWDADRPLATPALGYSFYPVYAARFGVPLTLVPMKNTLEVDVAALCSLPETTGVILANPNAPTSIALPLRDICAIADSRPGAVVLVDEAYVDFAANSRSSQSALTLINSRDNVLVVRTMSKSHSLAGMRVGFAAGSSELIDGLSRVRDSFNSYVSDRLAIAAACAALGDAEYLNMTRAAIVASRERLTAELRGLGFELPDSSSNFLFARHPGKPGAEIQSALRARGILVRRFSNPPEISDYLRVSIGSDDDCAALVAALRDIV